MKHLIKGNSIYSIQMYQLYLQQRKNEYANTCDLGKAVACSILDDLCQEVIDAYDEMCY